MQSFFIKIGLDFFNILIIVNHEQNYENRWRYHMSISSNPSTILYGLGFNYQSFISEAVAPLQAELSQYDSFISGNNTISSAWTGLTTGMKSLITATQGIYDPTSSFNVMNSTAATSSATGVATVTTTGTPAAGTYALSVSQIALNEIDDGTAQATGALGYSGKPTINGVAITVTSSMTLSQIASAINSAGAGVTASIVNNTLIISANSTDAPITYSDNKHVLQHLGIVQSNGTTPANQFQAAQPAKYTIDGVAVTNTTNTDTASIPGVTINLLSVGNSTITVSTDTSSINSAINAFITAYNANMTAMMAAASQTGSLDGNAVLEDAIATAGQNLNNTVSGTVNYSSAASIGITIGTDGQLQFNQTTFDAALASNPSDVSAIMQNVSTGLINQFTTLTQAGGTIQNITNSIANSTSAYQNEATAIQSEITNEEKQLQLFYAALQSQLVQDNTMAGLLSLNQQNATNTAATPGG